MILTVQGGRADPRGPPGRAAVGAGRRACVSTAGRHPAASRHPLTTHSITDAHAAARTCVGAERATPAPDRSRTRVSRPRNEPKIQEDPGRYGRRSGNGNARRAARRDARDCALGPQVVLGNESPGALASGSQHTPSRRERSRPRASPRARLAFCVALPPPQLISLSAHTTANVEGARCSAAGPCSLGSAR